MDLFIILGINFGLTVIGIFLGIFSENFKIWFNEVVDHLIDCFSDRFFGGKYKKELRNVKTGTAVIIIFALSLVLGLLTFHQSERESERTKEAIKKIEIKIDRLIEANEDIEDDSFQINE